MSVWSRALACAAALLFVWFSCMPAVNASEKLVRRISVFVNGERLRSETLPQVIDGRLYLPVRALFAALGIEVAHSKDTITAVVPAGNLVIHVGSDKAAVDGRALQLDAPVIRPQGVTYIPLRLLTGALGAVVSYDQRGARVEIISAYIGKNVGAEQPAANGGETITGVVSALDVNSVPPSVTVVAGGMVRTIELTSDTAVYVEDATVHSQWKGTLDDLYVGDALRVLLGQDGRVVEMHDFFKSRSGLIAAVSPSAFVLQDGNVVTPVASTTITLNAEKAKLSELQVRDYVTIRSNPESGELREVIASRKSSRTQVAGSPVAIVVFGISATRPLHAGEFFDVMMRGTPGGSATFDIGDVLTGLVMREQSPGAYVARFTIPARFNLARIPMYGHLRLGTVDAARAEAPTQLSAVTAPPQITEVAPPPGQIVNNKRPTIYATFNSPGDIGIDLSSITLTVNGHDVTAGAIRSPTFIMYSPGVDLPQGEIAVFARVVDAAGNVETRKWPFTVQVP